MFVYYAVTLTYFRGQPVWFLKDMILRAFPATMQFEKQNNLILCGEQGSGVSTSLYSLYRNAMATWFVENHHPFPLLLDAENWDPQQPILNWIDESLVTMQVISLKIKRI